MTRANGSAIRNIAIVNYSFRPPSVNITTGTQVVWTFWTNGTDSNDIHTVTANNQTQTGAGVFQSQTLRPGQTFNFTFNYPGKYPYHCAYHNFMTALVTVTGPPLTSPAASNSLVLYLELGAIAAVALAGTFVFYSRKRRKERPNMQS